MSDCKTGKISFDSYDIAFKVRGRYGRKEAGPYHVYKCSYCGKWHVGGAQYGAVKSARKGQIRRKRLLDELERVA